jgi:hypothetical protein
MNDPPSLIRIQKTDNGIACSIMPWVFKLAWRLADPFKGKNKQQK